MENIISLIKEKGTFYLSRKSVNSPYRMALRFNGLTDKDKYILAQFSDKINYKFHYYSKSARLISSKAITKLYDMGGEMEQVMSDSMLKDKKFTKVFNEYNEKNNPVSFVMEVDEELPF